MSDIYNPNSLDVPRVSSTADDDNLFHAIKCVMVVSGVINGIVKSIKDKRKKKH